MVKIEFKRMRIKFIFKESYLQNTNYSYKSEKEHILMKYFMRNILSHIYFSFLFIFQKKVLFCAFALR